MKGVPVLSRSKTRTVEGGSNWISMGGKSRACLRCHDKENRRLQVLGHTTQNEDLMRMDWRTSICARIQQVTLLIDSYIKEESLSEHHSSIFPRRKHRHVGAGLPPWPGRRKANACSNVVFRAIDLIPGLYSS